MQGKERHRERERARRSSAFPSVIPLPISENPSSAVAFFDGERRRSIVGDERRAGRRRASTAETSAPDSAFAGRRCAGETTVAVPQVHLPVGELVGQRLYRCRTADPSAAAFSAVHRPGGDLHGAEEAIGDIATAKAPIQAANLIGNNDVEPSPATVRPEAARPWNLRKRRAVCKEPSPAPAEAMKRGQGNGQPAARLSERIPRMKKTAEKERTKLFRELSRAEVEEDFIRMTGSKPPRRPKKWPKAVQKRLEALSPGFQLTEITLDMYKTSSGD
ncbi:unnamed protein product [Spirodela intermedia]|uniref:Uncharacterized protein n=1 Tax=Spirodela intermedia TaxID=51605 RepID=A0A7I8JTY2_SPIIN|nr:unnamed protein product [Spirodela intermedia]CAA6673211.1 unnamed protein product [Spirodela intermedia]